MNWSRYCSKTRILIFPWRLHLYMLGNLVFWPHQTFLNKIDALPARQFFIHSKFYPIFPLESVTFLMKLTLIPFLNMYVRKSDYLCCANWWKIEGFFVFIHGTPFPGRSVLTHSSSWKNELGVPKMYSQTVYDVFYLY